MIAKGRCHVWKIETGYEKKEADREVEILNSGLEPIFARGMGVCQKVALHDLDFATNLGKSRNGSGIKSMHGKLTRECSKGEVEWYRYYKHIVLGKLIPFGQECMIE
ncbi:hypothetical protein DFH27DRAFT_339010, partial [Peziza echinospora]